MATIDTQCDALDSLFDALSHPARRRTLTRCRDLGPRDGDDIAVAALATDEMPMNRQLAALYHQHLPKLAEAGYVTWDPVGGTVRRGPRFTEVEPVLALFEEHETALPASWP